MSMGPNGIFLSLLFLLVSVCQFYLLPFVSVTGNCSNPQPPDHGFTLAFNCTHHNCMALFSCEEGYWLDGSNTTVCTDSGNWTRNGSCERKLDKMTSLVHMVSTKYYE